MQDLHGLCPAADGPRAAVQALHARARVSLQRGPSLCKALRHGPAWPHVRATGPMQLGAGRMRAVTPCTAQYMWFRGRLDASHILKAFQPFCIISLSYTQSLIDEVTRVINDLWCCQDIPRPLMPCMLRVFSSARSLAAVTRTVATSRLCSVLLPSPRLVHESWAGPGSSTSQQLCQQMKQRITSQRTYASAGPQADQHGYNHSSSSGSKVLLTLPTLLTLARVAAVPVLIGGKKGPGEQSP